ncbi:MULTISPECIES: L-lysine 6-transaminase [Chitinophagaceae]
MQANVTKPVLDRLSKHILVDGFPFVMDLEKSHGSYIVTTEGETFLDMFTMFASSPIGYNHPYIVERENFLAKMAVNKPAMSDVYTEPFADFVDTFARVAMPSTMQYAFFVDGGGLGVENALKTAFDWRTRLNLSRGIDVEAGMVIHFKQAFHGRTGYTLSLTNTTDPRKYKYFPKFDWPRIINPKLYFPLTEASLSQTIQTEKEAIAHIEKALQEHPNKIACLIMETIQAEGGDNYFRKEFFQQIRSICDQYDILMILDEVQTGVGLTGKVWAFQNYDVQPDIIAFGKKAQIAGILAYNKKIDQVEHHVFKESSRLNSTFGGNYLDMLRFKLILEVIEKENLVENAASVGQYLLEQIQQLPADKVSNQRGLGLFCSMDLPTAETRDDFLKKTFAHKLLIAGCGEKTVRFRPALNVSRKEIDQAIDIIKSCF